MCDIDRFVAPLSSEVQRMDRMFGDPHKPPGTSVFVAPVIAGTWEAGIITPKGLTPVLGRGASAASAVEDAARTFKRLRQDGSPPGRRGGERRARKNRKQSP